MGDYFKFAQKVGKIYGAFYVEALIIFLLVKKIIDDKKTEE